jgi:ferredoxin
LQLKAIFATLLLDFDFELSNAKESYVDDHSGMTVKPKAPMTVRYPPQEKIEVTMRIKVDLDLCQGHSVCMEECPEVFAVRDTEGGYPQVVVLQEEPDESLRTKVIECCARLSESRDSY